MARSTTVVLALFLAACTGAPTQAGSAPGATTPTVATTTVEPSASTTSETTTTTISASNPTGNASDVCDVGGVPWSVSLSAQAEPLLEQDGIMVDAVVYPHPEYDGNPWSQWGQGIVDQDGRFYSAIGDHLGKDGNSYVYEYDPATKQLSLIADVAEATNHVAGSWGYGKVHAQMVSGPCGVYLSTYWGTRRKLEFDANYQGDHLLQLDTAARTVSDLSVIAPEYGVPSLASSPEHGLIYAEAVDPFSDPNQGWFVVLDGSGHEVFRSDTTHVGFRAMAVDAAGRALFSASGGSLAVYDPDANEVTSTIAGLPGEWLRAATAPTSDGTIFGVTREPDELFALTADGTVRSLGPVQGYTTSLALSPDGGTLYYVPYAHGGAWRQGTPLVSVDTQSGEQTDLLLLNEAAEQKLGLTLGGSYNVVMSPDGNTLYIGMNAGLAGSEDTFGSVVLLIVHLGS